MLWSRPEYEAYYGADPQTQARPPEGSVRQGAHSQPYMYSIRFTHSTFQFVLFEWRAPAPRPSHSQHILNWTDSALSAGIDFDAYPSPTLRPIVAPVRPGLSRLQFFPPLAPWGPAPGRVLDATARCLSGKTRVCVIM